MTLFNPSYVMPRPDIETLIPNKAKFVMDVGCSTGVLGAAIKAKTGAYVAGIELSQKMADKALQHIDKVFVGDAHDLFQYKKIDDDYSYDVIIFADVLEHIINPWGTLLLSVNYLNTGGYIIASIPNIRHISTIYNLTIKGYWPYRERGIHDQTHLRFFTKKNIYELFEYAGLKIDLIKINYRLIEKPHYINRFAKYTAFPIVKDFFAFQYLIRAKVN